jgi:hypothetical protein
MQERRRSQSHACGRVQSRARVGRREETTNYERSQVRIG